MDLDALFRRAVESWADRVATITPDQWSDPTPCRAWSVRDLVNHVVGEERWSVPLVGGSTIAEVADRLDGDLLGADPIAAAADAAREAMAAVARALPAGGVVHLSYGDEQLAEYVHQLLADHLLHGWDLAAATGTDTRMDDELVAAVGAWFAEREELYRAAGMIGPRGASYGGEQSALLAGFGRDAAWGPGHAALAAFSAAFGSGDVDAIMALMTDDCVFESTGPAPDGERYASADAVRAVWVDLFGGTREPTFTEEDSFVVGDRGVLRWRFDWLDDAGAPGHVRGVDVVRLRDAKVCEKLSYVKG